MPGIAGIISRRPAMACQAIVKAMTRSMVHEQFYCSDFYDASSMGVYVGWVALENSFAVEQVLFNEQENVAIVLSGECFPDRRVPLESNKGRHHSAIAAANWLTRLYEDEGDNFFGKLNGLFSGLLVDKKKKCAFLFNDRYGVERLYVHQAEDTLYFASEAKALLRVVPELRSFDEEGVVQYLAFGCTLDSRTLFRGVSRLPGGSLWSFEQGRCRKGRYFTPAEWESQGQLSAQDFEDGFDEMFKRILPRYFESASKTGISLTGGLDTRIIMAARPETSQKPICYTFDGGSADTLDTRIAARVAKCCGLDHHVLRLDSEFFSDFDALADKTVYLTDGCSGVLGAHEIYLNRKARTFAPIRITGNFGSEVLRSMSTFKPVKLSRSFLDPDFGLRVQTAAGGLANSAEHPVTFAAFKEIPWNLFGTLAAGRSQISFRTPYLDNDLVALAFRAPESLRTTPYPALRFIKRNRELLSRIPTDRGLVGDAPTLICQLRHFLTQANFKFEYHTNEGLPDWLSTFDPLLNAARSAVGIFGRHKYLHYRSWLRKELAGYLNAAIRRASAQGNAFWNFDILRQLDRAHMKGRRNYLRELNAVLTLEAIERLLLQGYPSIAETFTDTAVKPEPVPV